MVTPANISTCVDIGITNILSSISTSTNYLSSNTLLDINSDPKYSSSPIYTKDNLGDEEIEFILEDTYKFLKNSSDKLSVDLETKLKNSI